MTKDKTETAAVRIAVRSKRSNDPWWGNKESIVFLLRNEDREMDPWMAMAINWARKIIANGASRNLDGCISPRSHVCSSRAVVFEYIPCSPLLLAVLVLPMFISVAACSTSSRCSSSSIGGSRRGSMRSLTLPSSFIFFLGASDAWCSNVWCSLILLCVLLRGCSELIDWQTRDSTRDRARNIKQSWSLPRRNKKVKRMPKRPHWTFLVPYWILRISNWEQS